MYVFFKINVLKNGASFYHLLARSADHEIKIYCPLNKICSDAYWMSVQ